MVLGGYSASVGVFEPGQEFIDELVVNEVKADFSEGDPLFLKQEFSKKIKAVSIGLDRILAAAFVFWKKNG
jgi:hypothetical protein